MIYFVVILNSILMLPVELFKLFYWASILGISYLFFFPRNCKRYALNNLLAVDQSANTVLGGDPDITISTRVYLARNDNKVARLVWKFLELIDKRHGEKAAEYEKGQGGEEVL